MEGMLRYMLFCKDTQPKRNTTESDQNLNEIKKKNLDKQTRELGRILSAETIVS